MATPSSLASQMASLAEAAVTAARNRVTLDYSVKSIKVLESLIADIEQDARIALDLPDDARVADFLDGLLDIETLGAYYGELFVRHAGAVWGEAQYEGLSRPAVMRGTVILHPQYAIHRRVYDGRHVDLAKIFRLESKAMAKQ